MQELMEFILPVVFASGEAMIWVLLIVALIVIGRGRLEPSEKTLFIERESRYSMELAPGLNLALPFVEAIAEQVSLKNGVKQDGALLCYEVLDRHIATRKLPSYLLLISIRKGVLHFETIPVSERAKLNNPGLAALIPGEYLNAIENTVRAIGESWTIELRKVIQYSPPVAA